MATNIKNFVKQFKKWSSSGARRKSRKRENPPDLEFPSSFNEMSKASEDFANRRHAPLIRNYSLDNFRRPNTSLQAKSSSESQLFPVSSHSDQDKSVIRQRSSFSRNIDIPSASLSFSPHQPTMSTISFTTAPTNESEITPATQSSPSDVEFFINNLSSCSSQLLCQVLKCVDHENIKSLHESCGYRLDILIYVTIDTCLANSWSNLIERLLDDFWKANFRRLQHPSFYHFIESNSSAILNVKNSIVGVLKERTKNSLVCVECRQNTVSILYLPCGHIIVCSDCQALHSFHICRACKSSVSEFHNVYF